MSEMTSYMYVPQQKHGIKCSLYTIILYMYINRPRTSVIY